MCLEHEHKPRFYNRKVEFAYKVFYKYYPSHDDGSPMLMAAFQDYRYDKEHMDADGWFNTTIKNSNEGFYAFQKLKDAQAYLDNSSSNWVIRKVAVKDVVVFGTYTKYRYKCIRCKSIKILED